LRRATAAADASAALPVGQQLRRSTSRADAAAHSELGVVVNRETVAVLTVVQDYSVGSRE
jgi:hypothetical protein